MTDVSKPTFLASRRSLLAAAASLAMPHVARAQAPAPLVIATGGTGGVYYPLGGGIAAILGRDLPAIGAKVQATGGSVANLQMLAAGQAGIGFTQVDAAVAAYEGDAGFRGRPVPVRTLAVLHSEHMQVVTTAASGIQTLQDLKGKRVSTGAAGSGTELMAFRLLVAAGMDRLRDFAAREQLGPGEGTKAIQDGKLDAYFFVSGIPAGAITDLGAAPGTQVAFVDHAGLIPGVLARHGPVYFAETIPASTYPGQRSDYRQVSVANILAVTEAMPDDQVAAILGELWTNHDDLVRAHAVARHFTLDGQKAASAGVPYHPAAELFWRSRGATLA